MNREVDAWGRVVFHGEDAVELLMRGYEIGELLFAPGAEIAAHNEACRKHDKTDYLIEPAVQPAESPQEAIRQQQATWFMPASYCVLPVRERLLALCQRPEEIERVNHEMDLFEARDLIPVLQLMWFLVDHFRTNGVLWGVGRGSSVASYCLFLIGLHRIDAIHYDLDIAEFLK